MTTAVEDPRLFKPFLDVTDMVVCRSANFSLAEINHEVAGHQLRFPLVCDAQASLAEHLAALDHASRSARFGPFADNILGMNWQLKTGQVVRIGERVIKSATGYDLMRFLLHTDGRYGQATDYVLRLRPLGGETLQVTFTGPAPALERACAALCLSSWIHWFDVVDLCLGAGEQDLLQVEIDCIPGEAGIFNAFLHELGKTHGLGVSDSITPSETGLPLLSIKTIRSSAAPLARRLVGIHGGRARVLCLNGVIFYYPPAGRKELPAGFLAELAQQCEAEGGHLNGSWAPTLSPTDAETNWANQLEAAWNQL